jgi:peptide/nickel transport system substrate-binding protein
MVTQPHSPTMEPSLFVNLHDNSTGDAIFTLVFKYSSQGGQSFTHDAKLDKLIADGGKATGETRTKDFQEAFKVITQDILPDVQLWHMVGYGRVGPRIDYAPNSLTNNELDLATIKFKAAQ